MSVKQMNVHVPQEFDDQVVALGKRHGWSKQKTVMRAVEALEVLMGMHDEVAQELEPDLAEFYRRVAREAPARLVELKGSTQLGWMNEKKEEPAAVVDGWFIYADPDTGELMAVKGKQSGRYIDGEVRPVAKKPSPDKAVLKSVAS